MPEVSPTKLSHFVTSTTIAATENLKLVYATPLQEPCSKGRKLASAQNWITQIVLAIITAFRVVIYRMFAGSRGTPRPFSKGTVPFGAPNVPFGCALWGLPKNQ